MTAQLVLQFETDEDLDSFDWLIRFEEALSSVVGKIATVDGHDFGAGEMNIFILTENPTATFAMVQQMYEYIRPGQRMRAAYRMIDREEYICLWPPELNIFNLA